VSHSPGQVLDVIGEIVGYFEYNGTVDVARAKIFATADERDEAWRQDQPAPCSCPGVDVTLVAEGFTWEGRACLEHGFIVSGTSPLYGREDDDSWSALQRRRT
jgi:hypothetical protein